MMSDDIENTQNNMVNTLLTIIVAVILVGVVMTPIINSVANGSGGGSGGGGSQPITVSNEEYVLSKMAYGENPTFDISITDDAVLDEMTWIYQNPVLYADNTNVIARMPNDGECHIYFDPTSGTVGDEPNGLYYSHHKWLGTINRVVSDGQEITVYYTDRDYGDMTYTFAISSPGYYYDPNGEYGSYINPGYFDTLYPGELPSTTYDYLYIPSNYTPHIVWSSDMYWQMAYDRSGIMGVYDTGYGNLHCYYDINDNKITDAGWDMDTRYNGVTTHVHSACYFMILPNTFTYTPGEDEPVDDGPFNLKTLYGQSYPWTTVSGGYISQGWADSLTITNSDFKQMPWETGQFTLDANMNPAFWSIDEDNGDMGFKLDLLALMEYYSDYAQILVDAVESVQSANPQKYPYPEDVPYVPAYMIMTGAVWNDHPTDVIPYISPIGVDMGLSAQDDGMVLTYGIMPKVPNGFRYPIDNDEVTITLTDVYLVLYNGPSSQVDLNVYYHVGYEINTGGQTFTEVEEMAFHVDSVLFLGESETGYVPLGLDGMNEIPLDKMTQYIGVNVNCGALSDISDEEYDVTISMLNVADTIIHNVQSDNDESIIYPIMYDYTGQFTLYPECYEYSENTYFYTSTTENAFDIDELGWGWYEDGTYSVWFDSQQYQEESIHYLICNTLGLAIPAEESGGEGGSGGSGGKAGMAYQILMLMPILVILSLIAIVIKPYLLDRFQ